MGPILFALVCAICIIGGFGIGYKTGWRNGMETAREIYQRSDLERRHGKI